MKLLLFLPIFTLIVTVHSIAQQASSSFTAKNPSMLYLGGVMKKNEINEDEHKVLNLIDEDITMSFNGAPVRSTTFSAGKDNMYRSINEAFSSTSSPIFQNNSSFSYNLQEIQQYSSVQNYLGQRVNLQEWFGVSPDANKPTTLMVLDMIRTAFTISLDMPFYGSFKTDPNEIAKHNLEDLIYINSLSFGRRILVLVESNLDKITVTNTLKNVLEGEKISDKDDVVLANCTFRTIVFGGVDLPLTPHSPFKHILEYIEAELRTDSYGLPIYFGAAYLKDNSVFENKY